MEIYNADIFLELNLDFWQDLEINCVAECCGINAFNFSKEELENSFLHYNKIEIKANIITLIDEIKTKDITHVSSTIFNITRKPKVFIETLNQIKNNIN